MSGPSASCDSERTALRVRLCQYFASRPRAVRCAANEHSSTGGERVNDPATGDRLPIVSKSVADKPRGIVIAGQIGRVGLRAAIERP